MSCFSFQCVSEIISVVLVQFRRYDGCMINFLINENVVSGICSLTLKTKFFSCMFFKFFAEQELLEWCKLLTGHGFSFCFLQWFTWNFKANLNICLDFLDFFQNSLESRFIGTLLVNLLPETCCAWIMFWLWANWVYRASSSEPIFSYKIKCHIINTLLTSLTWSVP